MAVLKKSDQPDVQFYGENMLRADVCNAVEELGQLLTTTAPSASAMRRASRIITLTQST